MPASKAMHVEVDVTVAVPAWTREVAEAADQARCAVRRTLATHADACPPTQLPLEVAVLLADDACVRDLNRRFCGKDKPTNVLSFPARSLAPLPGAESAPLGDIVLACETVCREAVAESKSVSDHMTHLLVHGTLHLLGFTHDEDADTAAMNAAEVAVLASLGVPDPYRAAPIGGASQ